MKNKRMANSADRLIETGTIVSITDEAIVDLKRIVDKNCRKNIFSTYRVAE
jgi:hypothetical protein